MASPGVLLSRRDGVHSGTVFAADLVEGRHYVVRDSEGVLERRRS